MMFRHMAMLRFKPDATAEAERAFFENFPKMAISIPQIKAWSMGPNAGSGVVQFFVNS